MAQNERLRRLVPDDRGGLNFDLDQNTASNLSGLIFTVTGVLNGAGAIAYSSLNTLIQTASLDPSAILYKVIGIKDNSNSNIVKYVRNNDLWANYNNYFKRPSIGNYQYTLSSFGIYFYPTIVGGGPTFDITVIKTPRVLTVGNSPDWDDTNCNLILMLALQYAQMGTRDEELLASIRNSNVAQ